MIPINEEFPMLPKRAEQLDKVRKKLQEEFYINTRSDEKEFKEKESFLLRVRRAISWLDGAQQVEKGAGKNKNISAQFIFFWISFNALYEKNLEFLDSKPEDIQHMRLIKEYFDDILATKDAKSRIKELLNNDLSQEIKLLTKNRFIRRQFRKGEKIKNPGPMPDILPEIIRIRNTKKALYNVFECLYILRNQLMHGHSTLGSKLNKKQVHAGIEIMQCFLPTFIDMENSDNNSPSSKKKFKGNGDFLLRANSWLDKAEKGLKGIGKDITTQFIFLWIGFNAIYAGDPGENLRDEDEIKKYFQNLLDCNEAKDTIYNVIDRNILKEKIEFLENNISLPLWNIESTEDMLCYIFQPLLALRDRLVHGFEIWDCKLKKNQLTNSTKIMHTLLPVFIDIMLKIPEKEWNQWGKIRFPRVLGVRIEGEPWEETSWTLNKNRSLK